MTETLAPDGEVACFQHLAECQLVLFSKPALPRRVKTRLTSRFSAVEAAAIHRALLGDLASELARGEFSCSIAWALEASEDFPLGLVPEEVTPYRQFGEDLGHRLYNALACYVRGSAAVGAIGSDHALVSAAEIENAFHRLRAADVVLGPAEDGGYYLLLVRSERLVADLFRSISWSSRHVFEQTLERCRTLGYRVAVLAERFDVDTPADVDRLALILRRDQSARRRCPRCWRLVEKLQIGASET